MRKLLPLFFLLVVLASACHKEEQLSSDQDDKLGFSEEEIFFDTIFTSVGSVTQRFKVYNHNSKAVIISSIELAGKASSPYTIIIDGLESNYRSNLTLRGGDSMYVLVKVNIDPQNQSLPFLVSDSILFTTNGNLQKVKLRAYGQDATFLSSAITGCDTVWTNVKPFVIANYVRVPAGCTLTLSKGVRVYFHDNAFMDVQGTLLVQGEKDSIVTFSGDKFLETFKDLPGQWQGITFGAASKNNSINYALIKNALTGIKILHDPADADTIAEVKLSNTIVKNMQGSGVEAYGTDVHAYNTLFSNCVRETFAGLGGGNYHFRHCTFTNYSYFFFREEPAIRFNNNSGSLSNPLKTRLTNCIVWGDRTNELQLTEDGLNIFDFSASKTIIKTSRTDQGVNGNLINTDPLFEKPVSGDFHLKAGSPAINTGQNIGIIEDLEGKPRDVNPDIGAYEK